MLNDLKKGYRLVPYGVSRTMNLVFMVFFALLGAFLEVLIALGQTNGHFFSGLNTFIDLGAVFLFCAVMFPGQLVTSLDVSLLAQASPYKRKLQTDMASLVTLFGNLAAMAVIVTIRLVIASLFSEQASAVLGTLPLLGLVGFALIVYSGLMYKFFVISIIVLYVVMVIGGVYSGFGAAMGNSSDLSQIMSLPTHVAILLCFVLVLAGSGLQYLITRLAYKRPLSKYAFGSAIRKQM